MRVELTPLAQVPGIGPATCEALAKLGLTRLIDAWLHWPAGFQDRTRITPIAAAVIGEPVQLLVEVLEAQSRGPAGWRAQAADDSGTVQLKFYTGYPGLQAQLRRGQRLLLYGVMRVGLTGRELTHPELQVVAGEPVLDHELRPIYPSTAGLSQQRLRAAIGKALERLDALAPELLELIDDELPGPSLRFADALRLLHRLDPQARVYAPARLRLAVEELAAHQLALLVHQQQHRNADARPLAPALGLREAHRASLGFALTAAQQRVLAEIDTDLSAAKPMLRLLQGDVGAGKTLVAFHAMLSAVAGGGQALLIAPTELLAAQHARSLAAWAATLNLELVELTGKLPAAAKRAALKRIARGAGLVVGTHAVLQNEVSFADLLLVVIDEQHRFGVEQRLSLSRKARPGYTPHQLSMSATPIPRTLALTLYAGLALSVIDQLPPGRTPVRTALLPKSRRAELIVRLGAALASGRQAYWVCTLIEQSEQLDAQPAEAAYAELCAALPAARIALIHGRMGSAARAQAMQAFVAGEVDLLVATTVIEVGVDVPRASVMVIEDAQRLGLAQLHQLRGRVGRGAVESSCVLFYDDGLSDIAKARLRALRDSNDGFWLAEQDLKLRGPGEVLGTRQAGLAALKVADLAHDEGLLQSAHALAHKYAANPQVREALIERWVGTRIGYARG